MKYIQFKIRLLPCITLLLTTVLFLISCSKNNDNDEDLSDEEITIQTQNNDFQKLKSILPGKWEPYEYYNHGTFPTRPNGWRPISEIYWDENYTFNSDGTCVKHTVSGDKTGTYRLEKNPNYIKEPRRACSVILYIDILYEQDYKIWVDEENYLHICLIVLGDDYIPYPFEGGDASIRYKKF